MMSKQERQPLMAEPQRSTKGFHFKQFSIQGGESGMPVSTDGVLLGAWAGIDQINVDRINTTSTVSILDIGTGTGLLSLMLAQRIPNAAILAVDIDQHAICAATENFAQSPWSKRLTLHHGNILALNCERPFDMIICNPPYFTAGQASQRPQRATARHTNQLNHQDLLIVCGQLLSNNGRANFILPVTEGEQFLSLAKQLDWFISRKCQVRPNAYKSPNRLLLELTKKIEQCEDSELIIKENNNYSQNFISLTKDFYLKM
jgi:tRNA1Val (adenine37-N6)-methyltransferase